MKQSNLTIKMHTPINRKTLSQPGYKAHERPTRAEPRAGDA